MSLLRQNCFVTASERHEAARLRQRIWVIKSQHETSAVCLLHNFDIKGVKHFPTRSSAGRHRNVLSSSLCTRGMPARCDALWQGGRAPRGAWVPAVALDTMQQSSRGTGSKANLPIVCAPYRGCSSAEIGMCKVWCWFPREKDYKVGCNLAS